MEPCYQTLSAIYEIVKADRAPQTYLCTPHEIILRQSQDWNVVEKHLAMLAAEQLVIIRKLDKIAVCITDAGIAKARSLKNNFVNDHFSFLTTNKDFLPEKNQREI